MSVYRNRRCEMSKNEQAVTSHSHKQKNDNHNTKCKPIGRLFIFINIIFCMTE